jgi:hypothetical protein
LIVLWRPGLNNASGIKKTGSTQMENIQRNTGLIKAITYYIYQHFNIGKVRNPASFNAYDCDALFEATSSRIDERVF